MGSKRARRPASRKHPRGRPLHLQPAAFTGAPQGQDGHPAPARRDHRINNDVEAPEFACSGGRQPAATETTAALVRQLVPRICVRQVLVQLDRGEPVEEADVQCDGGLNKALLLSSRAVRALAVRAGGRRVRSHFQQ